LWDHTSGHLLDASIQYVHAAQADPDPDAGIGLDANLQGFAPFVGDTELDVIFELHSRNNLAKYQSGTHYLIKWGDTTEVAAGWVLNEALR